MNRKKAVEKLSGELDKGGNIQCAICNAMIDVECCEKNCTRDSLHACYQLVELLEANDFDVPCFADGEQIKFGDNVIGEVDYVSNDDYMVVKRYAGRVVSFEFHEDGTVMLGIKVNGEIVRVSPPFGCSFKRADGLISYVEKDAASSQRELDARRGDV